MKRLAIPLASLLFVSAFAQEAQPKREAMISGRVVADDGQPMGGAQVIPVAIGKSPMTSAAQMTNCDAEGNFKVTGLSHGVYSLMAQAPGYVSVQDPSHKYRVGENVIIRMVRGGVITGRVIDEFGEPIVGVWVSADRVRDSEGKPGAADKRLAGMTTLIGAQNFSLRGVEDGEYDLSATGFNESMDFSVSTPRRVVVRGADLSGIELKLIKLGSVSGRIVIEAPKTECKTAFDQFKVEETLIELKRDDKTPSLIAPELFTTEAGEFVGGATPDKEGGFTAKNLEAGRYQIKADLPDENWYIRAITGAASPKPIDVARVGVTLKQGEKKSGIEMIVAQGAASLSGRVVPSREGAQPPKRLRVHLIPAETADADDLLRYAEAPVRGDGSYEFKHIAPGKYLFSARQASEKEANDDQVRPLAWDAIERAKLRREASAAKNEIELKVCERVKEHVLRW